MRQNLLVFDRLLVSKRQPCACVGARPGERVHSGGTRANRNEAGMSPGTGPPGTENAPLISHEHVHGLSFLGEKESCFCFCFLTAGSIFEAGEGIESPTSLAACPARALPTRKGYKERWVGIGVPEPEGREGNLNSTEFSGKSRAWTLTFRQGSPAAQRDTWL